MQLENNGVSASRVVCPQGHWATVFDFVCERFAFVSATQWQSRFVKGRVSALSGAVLTLESPFITGQTVCYFRENTQEKKLPFHEKILYQDDCLIVADKPHFLPVVPSGQYVQETLLARLKHKLQLPHLSPLHRIDRDTAGLVLFCVQPKQRGAYQNLFRDGLVAKQYQALAPYVSTLNTAAGPIRIANRLQTDQHFMQMHCVEGEVNAVTQVQSIERLTQNPNFARYTLQPQTGKRHQLRVHMMGLGAPIVGDAIYPVLLPERDVSLGTYPALQLLAQSLRFTDPITGGVRFFESQRQLSLGALVLNL